LRIPAFDGLWAAVSQGLLTPAVGMMLRDHSAVLEARDHETATRRYRGRVTETERSMSRAKRLAAIAASIFKPVEAHWIDPCEACIRLWHALQAVTANSHLGQKPSASPQQAVHSRRRYRRGAWAGAAGVGLRNRHRMARVVGMRRGNFSQVPLPRRARGLFRLVCRPRVFPASGPGRKFRWACVSSTY
jgi:hypothetical protein